MIKTEMEAKLKKFNISRLVDTEMKGRRSYINY